MTAVVLLPGAAAAVYSPEGFGPAEHPTHEAALAAWNTRPCQKCAQPMTGGHCTVRAHKPGGYGRVEYPPDVDDWLDHGPAGTSRVQLVVLLPDGQEFTPLGTGGPAHRLSSSVGITRERMWLPLDLRRATGCGRQVHLHTGIRPDTAADRHGGYFTSVWCECGWAMSFLDSHLAAAGRREAYRHALGPALQAQAVWAEPTKGDRDKAWKKLQEGCQAPSGWPMLVMSTDCQQHTTLDARDGVLTDHGCWSGADHHGDRYVLCVCDCHDALPDSRPPRCGAGYSGGRAGEGACLRVAVAPQPPDAYARDMWPDARLRVCGEHWRLAREQVACEIELSDQSFYGWPCRSAPDTTGSLGKQDPWDVLHGLDIVRQPSRAAREGWSRSDLERFVVGPMYQACEAAGHQTFRATTTPEWLEDAAAVFHKAAQAPRTSRKPSKPQTAAWNGPFRPVSLAETPSLFDELLPA